MTESVKDLQGTAIEFQRRLGDASATRVLSDILKVSFPSTAAVVTSLGADSAVLLHLVAEIDPSTPVLFIDTGRHFAETLHYRDRLVAFLGLKGLRTIGPTEDEARRLDPCGSLAAHNPDACCAFRKVAPLDRALRNFDAWITGRKRYQSRSREHLPVCEPDGRLLKFNPLANWAAEAVLHYMIQNNLPRHPLVDQGYLSIGCAPCTSPVRAGEDARSGRWRGFDKTECGIHSRLMKG
jgi:phosphoadenosine phosphosulfate reductase